MDVLLHNLVVSIKHIQKEKKSYVLIFLRSLYYTFERATWLHWWHR